MFRRDEEGCVSVLLPDYDKYIMYTAYHDVYLELMEKLRHNNSELDDLTDMLNGVTNDLPKMLRKIYSDLQLAIECELSQAGELDIENTTIEEFLDNKKQFEEFDSYYGYVEESIKRFYSELTSKDNKDKTFEEVLDKVVNQVKDYLLDA